MPPEHLAKAGTLSNIYIKHTILRIFGKASPIPLLAQQYHIFMGARRNFCSGWGQAEKKGPSRAQKVAKKPQHGEKATKGPK